MIWKIVCQLITFNWSLSNSNYSYDIPFMKLLSDRYILVAIGKSYLINWIIRQIIWNIKWFEGAICISTTSMSILESCLPLWLLEKMNPTPEKWQLGIKIIYISFNLNIEFVIKFILKGTVFIPDSIGYLIGTNFLTTCISNENKRLEKIYN